MPPAARLGDMHTCPMATPIPPAPAAIPHVGGPIMPPCFPTVLIGGQPAARMGDMGICTPVGLPDPIVKGSPTVFIGGMMAARMGDSCAHGGMIVVGCPTVLIGEAGNGGGGGGGPGMARSGGGDLGALSPLASGQAMSAPEVQKQALVAAAESGAPFCEVCQKLKEEQEAAAAKPKPEPKPKPSQPADRPSNLRADLPDDSFDNNGDLIWPKDDGFAGPPYRDVLEVGWLVDRYSTQVGEKDRGRFLSPEGTPYPARALPYDPGKMRHTVYRVVKEIPAKIGDIAPAFGEPGGGTQYLTEMSVGDLVKGGYLEIVQP